MGIKRKMFSLDRGASGSSSAWAAPLPLPFITTCSSVCNSGVVSVGVPSAAAANAACRLVLAPDIMMMDWIDVFRSELSDDVANTREDRFLQYIFWLVNAFQIASELSLSIPSKPV